MEQQDGQIINDSYNNNLFNFCDNNQENPYLEIKNNEQ